MLPSPRRFSSGNSSLTKGCLDNGDDVETSWSSQSNTNNKSSKNDGRVASKVNSNGLKMKTQPREDDMRR